MRTMLLLLLLIPALAAGAEVHALPLGAAVEDFTLRDHRGAERRLSDWRDKSLVVVAFLGVDCPLAKRYGRRLGEIEREFGPRVAVLGINANQHDTLRDIARYARRHEIHFPLLKDSDNHLADRFGATRTPEVFLLDGDRRLRYRGRVDDQYGVGTQRAKPTRRDLAEAIADLLAGKEVRLPVTAPAGCIIDRLDRVAATGRVTWTRDIGPVLQQHCIVCHRPGQVAPFALTTYRQARGWAETIREVVREGRMPPWHASPEHGRFANDPRLSERDKRLIGEWVDAGCPEGNVADLPPAPIFAEGWNIPGPDMVVPIPRSFTVPADGVVDYQYFEVDPGFTEDRWVRAAEIRPGNRAVVHHCTVFLKPPDTDEAKVAGKLGSFCLAATAPGTPPLLLPDGMAKRIPAGWRLLFVVHYTPVGTVQQDRTSIGLLFTDPKTVKKEVATHLLYDEGLVIPPHVANHVVEKSWEAPADVLLLAMFPHMHLRGKSFRYEALYPDGKREVLLEVPRYDFNWQHRYVLAEPKRLPAGTRVRCVARYDNSADNPSNPDPSATVRAGKQTTDEMFNGYFEWALADEDLTQPVPAEAFRRALHSLLRPAPLLALAALFGLLALCGLRRRRGSAGLQDASEIHPTAPRPPRPG
jgi:peroxiredoxin